MPERRSDSADHNSIGPVKTWLKNGKLYLRVSLVGVMILVGAGLVALVPVAYRDRVSVGNDIAAATQAIDRVDTDARHRDEMARQEAEFTRRELFYMRTDIRDVAAQVNASIRTPPPTSQPAISVR